MKTKLVVPILLLLSLTTIVLALQYSLEEECTTTTTERTIYEAYYVDIGTHANGTPQGELRTRTVTIPTTTTNCKQTIKQGSEVIGTPTLDGYTCTTQGNYAICDSTTDGNGDGVCASNGGETCCRIDLTTSETTCKNSETSWKPTKIPVREVRQ